MNPSSLISIIVLYYNSPTYFKSLLESIESQTVKDFEIIIIDDKSTPEAQKQLKEIVSLYPSLPITVVFSSVHQGVALGRNQGIKMAKGKYLTVIDSDDIFCGRYSLEYRINFLEREKDYSGIAGYPLMIDEENKVILNKPDKKTPFFQKAVAQPGDLRRIYCENIVENSQESASTLFFFAGSSLFRRQAIVDIGFDPGYEMEEDIEWIMRFLKDKLIKIEMVPFHGRRTHQEQYHLKTPSETTQKVIDLARDILKGQE